MMSVEFYFDQFFLPSSLPPFLSFFLPTCSKEENQPVFPEDGGREEVGGHTAMPGPHAAEELRLNWSPLQSRPRGPLRISAAAGLQEAGRCVLCAVWSPSLHW